MGCTGTFRGTGIAFIIHLARAMRNRVSLTAGNRA